MPDRRPTSTARGYDERWRKFRLVFICQRMASGDVYCAECGRLLAGGSEDIHVDHIQALVDGGEKYDETNLRLLHAACHSRRTIRDNGGFGRRT